LRERRSKLNFEQVIFEQVINVKNLVSLTLSEESKQSISIQSLALAGILTLAAILRFVGLGAESFWQDEILSVLGYQRPLLDIVTERLTYNQPFYFLMLYSWAQLFGESEFSLRFPSAVFGGGHSPGYFRSSKISVERLDSSGGCSSGSGLTSFDLAFPRSTILCSYHLPPGGLHLLLNSLPGS
jgi:hypothetical protein